MDIVRFKGGLGNQMFQYAFMEALKSKGRAVKASLGGYTKNSSTRGFFLSNVFANICLECVSEDEFNEIDEAWTKIKQNESERIKFCDNYENRFFWVEDVIKEPGTYQSNVFNTRNCTFVGYWQSEKYFKNIREQLIEKFQFTRVTDELKKVADMLVDNGYTSVHIRRGDYLLNPDVYMGMCTQEYYFKAIENIRQKNPGSNFIFFSDDMEWVRENINIENAFYYDANMVNKYEDWYDMYLMSKCQNNIIANSSFSWWGAWLNQNPNKIIIAPKRWYMNNDTPDIWCDGWIKL